MTPIPRTSAEILARIEIAKARDFFGAETSRLLSAVPFADAKAADIPKEGVTAEQWDKIGYRTVEEVRAEIADYLLFAWDKANSCRGLSANRSLEHLRGMLWLLGPEGEAIGNNSAFGDDYKNYGKPALVLASEFVGFDWPKVDNDKWTDGETDPGISAKQALGRE